MGAREDERSPRRRGRGGSCAGDERGRQGAERGEREPPCEHSLQCEPEGACCLRPDGRDRRGAATDDEEPAVQVDGGGVGERLGKSRDPAGLSGCRVDAEHVRRAAADEIERAADRGERDVRDRCRQGREPTKFPRARVEGEDGVGRARGRQAARDVDRLAECSDACIAEPGRKPSDDTNRARRSEAEDRRREPRPGVAADEVGA